MRAKTNLKIVDADHGNAEVVIADAAKQTTSMVQRLSTHRDRIALAVKELESERFELISKRDHIRRQAEAIDNGFAVHLDDIEDTLKLYESGLNSIASDS